MLNDSGITKKEQEQHPQTIVDIVGFYKENAEKGSDEVWDKFDHANVPEASGTVYTCPSITKYAQHP